MRRMARRPAWPPCPGRVESRRKAWSDTQRWRAVGAAAVEGRADLRSGWRALVGRSAVSEGRDVWARWIDGRGEVRGE